MVSQAIQNRWLTDDLKPLAIEAVRSGLQSHDERVRQTAVKSVLMMEAQNQKDEQHIDHLKLEQGTTELFALIEQGGKADVPVIVDAESNEVIGGGRSKAQPRTPSRKNKGRKSQ